MGGRYLSEGIPAQTVREASELALHEQWQATAAEIESLFEGFQFHRALERVFGFISGINKYAETRAPGNWPNRTQQKIALAWRPVWPRWRRACA